MENRVIITSERDKRTWDWLVKQVGEEAIYASAARLAGKRKPFLSNIAKELGLVPPSDLAVSTKETAKGHLAAIKAMLLEKQGRRSS